MKRRHPIIISLFMLALSFAAIDSYAAEVEIGDLNVDQESNPSFWTIEGSVRNLESHPIKGYVKIKFLNSNGSIVKSVAAAVNDAQPIEPTEVGAFVYRTFSTYFRGVEDFDVVFVEVKMRSSRQFGEPWEFVDWRKQQILRRTAEQFIADHDLGQYSYRFDIVSVLEDKAELFRNAF